jgi:hypothetical protein
VSAGIAVAITVDVDVVSDLQAQGRAFSQPQVDATSKVARGRATTLAGGELPREADKDKRIDPTTRRVAPKVALTKPYGG